MGIYTIKYKVTFDDVDQNLNIKNISLMKYLVDAAGMHSESVGYGLTSMDKTNIVFLLLGWNVKILKRPKLLDEITVKTWAESLIHSLSIRNYEIYEKDELVALASTKWIMVNYKDHSIMPVTQDVLDAYTSVPRSVFDVPIPKLSLPTNITNSYKYTIKRRDIDSNLHVNNLKYLELALEALSDDDYSRSKFSEICINYKNECKLGHDVVCNYEKISDDEHLIAIQSQDLSKIHAIIRLKK